MMLPTDSGPIYIPVNPPTCPSCGKDESIKKLCRHCGYEYSENDSSLVVVVSIIGAVLIIMMLSGFVLWLDNGGSQTILEILKTYAQ
jgi:uncharacterized protein (DUF983 family)